MMQSLQMWRNRRVQGWSQTGGRHRELQRLADHLAALLEAGLPIHQALIHLSAHPLNRHQSYWLRPALSAVQDGRSIASGWRLLAPPLLQTLLLAGEQSGHVAQALRAWSVHAERRQSTVREWVRLLSYPLVLVLLIGALLVFVARVVLPMFVHVVLQLGLRLTGPTRVIEVVLSFLPEILAGLVGVGLLLLAFIAALRTLAPAVWRRVKHLTPGARIVRLARTRTLAQLARLLLNAGIPLVDALTGLAASSGPRWLTEASEVIVERVLAGRPLAEAFAGDWDPLMEVLLRWAEQTGELGAAFARVEQYASQRLSERLKRLIGVVEPLLLFCMGVLVTASMYVVYVPMYDMMTAISSGQIR